MYLTLINNMKGLLCVLVTLSCCLLTWSSSAQAQEGQDSDEAFRKEVLTAQEAFGAEDFETAIVHLKRAHMVKADGRLFINIARSYEKLDDCALAIIYYNAFLNSPNPPAAMAKSIGKTVRSSKVKCKEYSDTLSGRLTIFTSPKGATVRVNGAAVGQTPLEVAGIESGSQSVVVEMDGHQTINAKVRLDSGADRVLKYNLKKAEVAINPDVESGGEEGSVKGVERKVVVEPSSEGGINIPAFLLIGVGAASLGAAIYLDLGLPAIDDERRAVGRDTPEFETLTDKRNTQSSISAGAYVAGSVLIAGGITWLLIDIVSSDDEASLQLAPSVAPGYTGVGLVGRF